MPYPFAPQHHTRIGKILARSRIYLPYISLGAVIYSLYFNPNPGIYEVVIVSILTFAAVFNSFFADWFVAPRVSEAIAREYMHKTYDLLIMSPLGNLGAFWIISGARLGRNRSKAPKKNTNPKKTRFLIGTMLILLFVICTWIAALALDIDIYNLSTLPVTMWIVVLIYGITTMLAGLCELEQTPAIGTLIGMLAPTYLRRPFEAQAAALFVFVVMQGIAYGFIYVVGFLLLPQIIEALNAGLIGAIALPILRLLVFAVVRESVVAGLWRSLSHRLRAHDSEINLAVKLLYPESA